MKYTIIKYQAKYQMIWDDFISRSANGTFLHKRLYMDYHAHRFDDFSLMIFKGEKLKAVLPANREGKFLFAHKGLTYSDFIYHYKLKFESKIEIIQVVLQYLYELKISHLYVKTIPFVFHRLLDQSNLYIYHQIGAELKWIKPFFIHIRDNKISPNRNRVKNIKKMSARSYYIKDSSKYLAEFWQVVEHNLKIRYKTTPVHTFEEISLLMKRFPKQIKLYTLLSNNKVLAGALVYYINRSMHFQYIHAVEGQQEREAVEWLIYHLFQLHKNKEFISFGTSSVEDNNLHKGLVYWKQSFGSTLINQYYFDIFTANNIHLKNILQ